MLIVSDSSDVTDINRVNELNQHQLDIFLSLPIRSYKRQVSHVGCAMLCCVVLHLHQNNITYPLNRVLLLVTYWKANIF